MNAQSFSLQPFPSSVNSLPKLQIIGTIARYTNKLAINYTLSGDLVEVAFASPTTYPTRQHKLWQETCFEFFLGCRHSPEYWEFNLSPSGDWNVYHFSDYRQGMQEEITFTALPFSIQSSSNSLSLSIELDLKSIISIAQMLEVAIATVIKYRNGKITYWALMHPGKEADFHRRDSFIIKLS